jgi:hypothetical protein
LHHEFDEFKRMHLNSVSAAAAKASRGERTTFTMHTVSQILFVTSVLTGMAAVGSNMCAARCTPPCGSSTRHLSCSYVFGGRAGVDKGEALNDLHW